MLSYLTNISDKITAIAAAVEGAIRHPLVGDPYWQVSATIDNTVAHPVPVFVEVPVDVNILGIVDVNVGNAPLTISGNVNANVTNTTLPVVNTIGTALSVAPTVGSSWEIYPRSGVAFPVVNGTGSSLAVAPGTGASWEIYPRSGVAFAVVNGTGSSLAVAPGTGAIFPVNVQNPSLPTTVTNPLRIDSFNTTGTAGYQNLDQVRQICTIINTASLEGAVNVKVFGYHGVDEHGAMRYIDTPLSSRNGPGTTSELVTAALFT